MEALSASGKKKKTTINSLEAEMTRFRVYVNPEWRDTLLVHAQEEKAFGFCPFGARRAVTLQIMAAVLIQSASPDNEKKENERMLKWKWGIITVNDWWPKRPHLQNAFFINRSVRNDGDISSFRCCFA